MSDVFEEEKAGWDQYQEAENLYVRTVLSSALSSVFLCVFVKFTKIVPEITIKTFCESGRAQSDTFQ